MTATFIISVSLTIIQIITYNITCKHPNIVSIIIAFHNEYCRLLSSIEDVSIIFPTSLIGDNVTKPQQR